MAHLQFEKIRGPTLVINCPVCKAVGVKAEAYDNRETANVILKHTTTWVKCGACGAELISTPRAAELQGMTAHELERVVRRRTLLVTQVLSVASILTFWLPGVGVLVCLAACLINRHRPGWRKACLILLLPAIAISAYTFHRMWADEHPKSTGKRHSLVL